MVRWGEGGGSVKHCDLYSFSLLFPSLLGIHTPSHPTVRSYRKRETNICWLMLRHLAAQVTCVPVTLLLLSISLEAFPAPSLSALLDLWMQRQQSSPRICTFTNSVKQLGPEFIFPVVTLSILHPVSGLPSLCCPLLFAQGNTVK